MNVGRHGFNACDCFCLADVAFCWCGVVRWNSTLPVSESFDLHGRVDFLIAVEELANCNLSVDKDMHAVVSTKTVRSGVAFADCSNQVT